MSRLSTRMSWRLSAAPKPPERYVTSLSPELLAKAEEELNEKEEWRERDLQSFRDMVLAHPALHSRIDNAFLLRFLRCRKFDYERAFRVLWNFYAIRAENDDVFESLLPHNTADVIDLGVSMVLPVKDKHGRSIIYDRPGKMDATVGRSFDTLRTIVMNLESMIQDEETQINGVVFISDFTGFGMSQAKNFERRFAKLQTATQQDAFPMRLKRVFIVNQPTLFTYVYNITRPFLRAKLFQRLSVMGTTHAPIVEELGADCLPEDLGGNLPGTDQLAQEWASKLKAQEAYFQEQLPYFLELPHEIMTKKNNTDAVVQGLMGTYKKLSTD